MSTYKLLPVLPLPFQAPGSRNSNYPFKLIVLTDSDLVHSYSKANPTVSWILIINPNSGPIKDAQDPSLYCVPKLRQTMGTDVEIVGYVRTGYNDRNLREIKRDVDMYKSWNGIKVEGGKYPKLDGIFYDETSDTTTTRLKAFATYAKSAFGSNAKVSSLIDSLTNLRQLCSPRSSRTFAFVRFEKNCAEARLSATYRSSRTLVLM